MWFFNKTKNIVGIAVHSNSIQLSLVAADPAHRYHLNYYGEYPLDSNEIFDALIFNPTQLGEIIYQFLEKYQIKNITAVLSLSANLITELLMPEKMGDIDHRHQFLVWRSYPLMLSGTRYIYSAALRHELFFQLQLLLQNSRIKNSTVTTENMVLYNLFHNVSNPKDQQELMTGDITLAAAQDYLLTQISNSSMLNHFIKTSNKTFPDLNNQQIVQALGHYLIGIHETV